MFYGYGTPRDAARGSCPHRQGGTWREDCTASVVRFEVIAQNQSASHYNIS
jgi:hypothetical protein